MTKKHEKDARIQEVIGKLVREARLERELNQFQLSAMAGFSSQGWLTDMEKGRTTCSLPSFYRLCEALGVQPGDFLPSLEEVGLGPQGPMGVPHSAPSSSAEGEVGGLAHSERVAEKGRKAERGLMGTGGRDEPTSGVDPEPDAA